MTLPCKRIRRGAVAAVRAAVLVLAIPTRKVLKLYGGRSSCSRTRSIARASSTLFPEERAREASLERLVLRRSPTPPCFPRSAQDPQPARVPSAGASVQIWSDDLAGGPAVRRCCLACWLHVGRVRTAILSVRTLIWIFPPYPDADCHTTCTNSCLKLFPYRQV